MKTATVWRYASGPGLWVSCQAVHTHPHMVDCTYTVFASLVDRLISSLSNRLEERRKRVRRFNTPRLWGSTRSLRKSEYDQVMAMMDCVIRCMIGWYEMRWYTRCNHMHWKLRSESICPRVSWIYTPHCAGYLRYPCILVHQSSPSPSP